MSYEFETIIDKKDYGRYFYHVLYLSEALDSELPKPRSRVRGTIEGKPFSGAWQPGGGRRFLILSKKFLKKADLHLGQTVGVQFTLDSPDLVEVPPALQKALDADRKMALLWSDLTPGKRRGLCHRVATAQRPETIQRRVEEVLEEIRW